MVIYLLYIALMSLFAIVLYAADKQKARKHKWRVKESVLLGVGFLGGAIGAIAAMQLFRHKTKHWYFWAVNILGLILHSVLFCLLFIF